jgi:hypothetical protein
MKSVYGSYDDLLQRIGGDMMNLDNEKAYSQYQMEQFEVCSRHYNSTIYRGNLRLFYEGKYTFD